MALPKVCLISNRTKNASNSLADTKFVARIPKTNGRYSILRPLDVGHDLIAVLASIYRKRRLVGMRTKILEKFLHDRKRLTFGPLVETVGNDAVAFAVPPGLQ